jgi:predicted nucleotide-binding protein
MALTEIERTITNVVIDRFLNLKQSTPRKPLVVLYRDIDTVDRLARYGILRAVDNNGALLPMALAFQCCGDEEVLLRARTSLEIALHVLQNLFEAEVSNADFTVAEVEAHANEMYKDLEPDALKMGLYLAKEFPIFTSWTGNAFEVSRLEIHERIATLNIEGAWDDLIRDRGQYLESRRNPQLRRAFLRHAHRLSGGREGIPVSLKQFPRVPAEFGLHDDEFAPMTQSLLSEGFIQSEPHSDSIALTHAGVLEVERHGGTLVSDGGATLHSADSRRVFVVHGRDEAIKEQVARFLEKLDLEAVILHEQPNKGRTLIEKFEAHSDVSFAVVLLTPDDIGGLASEQEKRAKRARQNVILELGYFIGKLGRHRVCALYVDGVELPSDIHGVLYVPYDAGGGWRLKVATEITAAGINVDLNKMR